MGLTEELGRLGIPYVWKIKEIGLGVVWSKKLEKISETRKSTRVTADVTNVDRQSDWPVFEERLGKWIR